jgi:hypothetical protein
VPSQCGKCLTGQNCSGAVRALMIKECIVIIIIIIIVIVVFIIAV